MAKSLNSQERQSNPHNRVAPPTCPLAIGPLTLTDLESVMALESVSFPTPWSLATYHNELTRNRRSRYLKVWPVPTAGDRPAAAALIAQGGIMLFGAEMHIVTLAVLPDWRGRSIGEWLLLALLALGRDEGTHTATLEVRVSNEIAQRLYRRAGFEAIGYRRRLLPGQGGRPHPGTGGSAHEPRVAAAAGTVRVALGVDAAWGGRAGVDTRVGPFWVQGRRLQNRNGE